MHRNRLAGGEIDGIFFFFLLVYVLALLWYWRYKPLTITKSVSCFDSYKLFQ